jgi:hypothetical protein
MHGDFSRLMYTTTPLDTDGGFTAVLGLQGRLTLEADANENVAILAHFLRTLVTDLVGPAAGPAADAGFQVTFPTAAGNNIEDLLIGAGHYYVGGLLVRTAATGYLKQPHPRGGLDDLRKALEVPTIAYLKVWEQLITAVEDPRIREVALGAAGPDTTARSKVAWQVLLAPAPAGPNDPPPQTREQALARWTQLEQTVLHPAQQGRLRARTPEREATDEESLCALSPDSRYRGAENQLYRVEIHSGGEVGPDPASPSKLPTFKWSRDNGSVVFPIAERSNADVTVTTLGRDDRLALDVGDMVELVDDNSPFDTEPDDLLQVKDIDVTERLVTLAAAPARAHEPDLHPFLRRWDQTPEKKPGRGNAVVADDALDGWMDLEDGIQIKFEPGSYRSRDHWTIPARVETGDIIWPADPADHDTGAARDPEGITYLYAPLAYVTAAGQAPIDMRCIFPTLGCDGAKPRQA